MGKTDRPPMGRPIRNRNQEYQELAERIKREPLWAKASFVAMWALLGLSMGLAV